MTTFPLQTGTSSQLAQLTEPGSAGAASPDLMSLTRDIDSLAQHMQHCASARSRWSRLQMAWQYAHSLLSPRIVTAAAVMAVVTLSVAVVVGWVAAV